MKAEIKGNRLGSASAVRVPARVPAWVVPAVKTLLAFTDLALALLSLLAAFHFRHHVQIFYRAADGSLAFTDAFGPYAALLPFVLPIRVLLLRYYDLYRLRGEFSFVEDALRVFKATAIASLLIVATAFMYRGVVTYRTFSYSRGIFLLDFVFALLSIGLVRVAVRATQIFVRQREINLIPTLVVGCGPEAALCIREMRARPELGYRVIGVVENDNIEMSGSDVFEGVPDPPGHQ